MEALFSKSDILPLEKHLISYKPDINRPADNYPKRTEYAWNSEIRTDIFLAKGKKKVIQAVFVWKIKNRSLCHIWQERPGWVMIDVTCKNNLSLENDIRIIRIWWDLEPFLKPGSWGFGKILCGWYTAHCQTSSEQKPGVMVLSDYISEWWV